MDPDEPTKPVDDDVSELEPPDPPLPVLVPVFPAAQPAARAPQKAMIDAVRLDEVVEGVLGVIVRPSTIQGVALRRQRTALFTSLSHDSDDV